MLLYICEARLSRFCYLFSFFLCYRSSRGSSSSNTFLKARGSQGPAPSPSSSLPSLRALTTAAYQRPGEAFQRMPSSGCRASCAVQGLLSNNLKLFTALAFLRPCSPAYSFSNIYCAPTVFQTQLQVPGVGGKKVQVWRYISMTSTFLKAQQVFTRCCYLNILKDI